MSHTLDALRGLHASMEAIRATLEADDLAALPALLDGYDRQVEAFCALPDARSLRDEVAALHEFQQDTIALMQERKAGLLELIRRQRQSTRAASAYATGTVAA